jgi:hypothetical protein
MNGSSSYEWIPDPNNPNASKDIDLDVYVTIDDASVYYDGTAGSDGETASAACNSGGLADGGGGGSYAGDYYPSGSGSGSASSTGSPSASNSFDDVDPDYDDTYLAWGPSWSEYGGSLGFTCEAYMHLYYEGVEGDNDFRAFSSVEGAAFAQGQATVNGSFSANASYSVSGISKVYLSGNIE